jgi:hypothetical protein
MPDNTLRLQAGMPLAERQAIREQILARLLDQARIQAAETGLSARCLGHLPHRAPRLSEGQRRLEHDLCQGESAGDGCLCELHDIKQDGEGAVSPAQLP